MNDILFTIGLWSNFETSTSIIRTCKNLWYRKRIFYKQKHLLWYSKPLLNIWNPEQQFYASSQRFTLFVDDLTEGIEISNLYEYNNTVKHMIDDVFGNDYIPTFYIEAKFLIVCLVYPKRQQGMIYDPWSCHFCSNDVEIKNVLNEKKIDFNTIRYVIIDLSKITPCWHKFNDKPYMDYSMNDIYKNRKGDVIDNMI
jgi:hypothetical protein